MPEGAIHTSQMRDTIRLACHDSGRMFLTGLQPRVLLMAVLLLVFAVPMMSFRAWNPAEPTPDDHDAFRTKMLHQQHQALYSVWEEIKDGS